MSIGELDFRPIRLRDRHGHLSLNGFIPASSWISIDVIPPLGERSSNAHNTVGPLRPRFVKSLVLCGTKPSASGLVIHSIVQDPIVRAQSKAYIAVIPLARDAARCSSVLTVIL